MRVQAAFENRSSATPSGPSTLKRQAAATGGDDNPSPSRQGRSGTSHTCSGRGGDKREIRSGRTV